MYFFKNEGKYIIIINKIILPVVEFVVVKLNFVNNYLATYTNKMATEDEQVGKQFVLVYFRTLFQDPMTLLRLYKDDSSLTRAEGSEIKTYKGLKVNLTSQKA